MKIYKELEAIGFFKWYCCQYGGLVFQEYKPVYDDLPLDNLIRTELNACAFKFFREKFGYYSYIKEATKGRQKFYIEKFDEKFFNSEKFDIYDEAEFECLVKLIQLVKN
jgi:hypothetical protein